MAITNFKNLAKTDLRKKALLVAEAGYEAIDIEKSIKDKIKLKNNVLSFATARCSKHPGVRADFGDFKNVYIIGVGKGSALASYNLAKILGNRLTAGIALDVNIDSQPTTYNLQLFKGTHPLPSLVNVKATKKIIELVKKAGKDDLVITFVCGGGSALLCGDNKELKCSQNVFKELTRAGADIIELNTVRKHLSMVKGGGLAKIAYPATTVSLIVSDVLGNDLSMIASGPTVLDKTTKKDAERILKIYSLNPAGYSLLETPKDKKYFQNVQNVLFVSNKDALTAMEIKAQKLKLKPKIYSYQLKGEAKNIFSKLAKRAKKNEVVLAGGETVVRIKNKELGIGNQKIGKGGRNMESVLGALNTKYLLPNTIFLSFASDGHDNTDSAGAIGDTLTFEKAKKLKLNTKDYLNRHDSFTFFEKTKDAIYASKKSFNVADLMVVIKA